MKPTEQWHRIEFSKTMSDVERLRIIGLLSQRPASAAEVADALHMPKEDAKKHLDVLEQAEIVHALESKYRLDEEKFLSLARQQSIGPVNSYLPLPSLDARSRKTLAAYLNPDGSIRQLPSSPEKLKAILDYLVAAFTPCADYTEKEVNTVLRRFHLDVSGLRRDLIVHRLMDRESDGSRYWRTAR